MDPLSDVLRAVRLTGAYFYQVEASPPWSAAAGRAREFRPEVLPHADHLIPYHILVRGECWAGLEGRPQVKMNAGDVVVFPQGGAHLVSSERGRRAGGGRHGATPLRYPDTVRLGAGKVESTIVCGFLGLDARPFNPLIDALPEMIAFPSVAGSWLSAFPAQVVRESHAASAGAETMLTRMAELMFVELLRRYIDSLGEERTGWLAGLRDPVVGRALGLMHERPSHEWTLASLARGVAASRSVVAERFSQMIGIPPMQYLAKWRLQLATEALASGDASVAAIGRRVGYSSEAAFSRAFKRAVGASPAVWRRKKRG